MRFFQIVGISVLSVAFCLFLGWAAMVIVHAGEDGTPGLEGFPAGEDDPAVDDTAPPTVPPPAAPGIPQVPPPSVDETAPATVPPPAPPGVPEKVPPPSVDPKTGSREASAVPPQHGRLIAPTLKQDEGSARLMEVIDLTKVDPKLALLSINKLFGGGGDEPNPNAPQVDADPMRRQLLIRGTASHIAQIRTLLEKMGEPGTDPFGSVDPTLSDAIRSRRVSVVRPTGDPLGKLVDLGKATAADLQASGRYLESRTRRLAEQYAKAKDTVGTSNRDKLKGELARTIARHFDVRHQARKLEIDELEARVRRLRGHLQKRQEARQPIVEMRLKQFISAAEGLGWDADPGRSRSLFDPYNRPGSGSPPAEPPSATEPRAY